MVDIVKIEAIRACARPTSVIKIWSFVGLTDYSRRFVKCFSTLDAPLSRLTHVDVPHV